MRIAATKLPAGRGLGGRFYISGRSAFGHNHFVEQREREHHEAAGEQHYCDGKGPAFGSRVQKFVFDGHNA